MSWFTVGIGSQSAALFSWTGAHRTSAHTTKAGGADAPANPRRHGTDGAHERQPLHRTSAAAGGGVDQHRLYLPRTGRSHTPTATLECAQAQAQPNARSCGNNRHAVVTLLVAALG